MKNDWHVQQWEGNRKELFHLDLRSEPHNLWKIRTRKRNKEEVVIQLRNGDLLMLCFDFEMRVKIMVYSEFSKLRAGRELLGCDLPQNIALYCSVSKSIFATIDNNEHAEIQTLRTHDAEADIPGGNEIRFYGQRIFAMVAVETLENDRIIVLGDKHGKLLLIRYRDRLLSKQREFDCGRPQGIFAVGAMKQLFWAIMDDGLVIIWDISTRRQVGAIENPYPVEVYMYQDTVVTKFEGVLRVYESKGRVKFKYVARLPLHDLTVRTPSFIPLNHSVGMVHDEQFDIVFFELRSGRPISRLVTPFNRVSAVSVLADGSLFLSSENPREGHAILNITEPAEVFEALRERAMFAYSRPLSREPEPKRKFPYFWTLILFAAIAWSASRRRI